MNKQIDWSKAPKGATHCNTHDAQMAAECRWYSVSRDGVWRWDGARWLRSVFSDAVVHWSKRPVTPTWNGPEDGLPPVGCEIEVLWSSTKREYVTGKVLAHDEDRAVFRFTSGERKGEYQADKPHSQHGADLPNFRPIRTAEQRAAEEHRSKYMPELIKLWDADTPRTEFLEAVYAMIVEAGKP